MTRFDSDARPDDDARSGTGVNASGEIIPVEAAISATDTRKLHAQAELSEQILEERARRASAPLSMEGLRPLPPGTPRTPSGVIPGGPGALGMTPAMRRTKPAPFKRQRISVDHHGKTWAYVRADEVRAGDIVPGVGKVEEAGTRVTYDAIAGVRAATGSVTWLRNGGSVTELDPAEQVLAFRVHDRG